MAKSKKLPNPIDVYVGSRIRSARLLTNMSQTVLGHALGLTFQQVQKYEKGTNRVSSSTLQTIANAVGRKVAWFFEGAPDSTKGKGRTPVDDPCKQLGMTREGVALARAFNAISDPKIRAAILAVAKGCGSTDGSDCAVRNGPR